MFVQLSSDDADTFAFLFTKDIEAGTHVVFTDNAWDQHGYWRTNASIPGAMTEDAFVWTAPSNISAGVIVTNNSHNLALAASGENLFAFQGSWVSPNFVSGASWDNTMTWRTSGAATANDSYLPPGLSAGVSAFARGIAGDNTGNTAFVTNGTTAVLRDAIYGTPGNWSTHGTAHVPPTPGPYTFTDAVAAPKQTNTIAMYTFGLAAASYTETAIKIDGLYGAQATFGIFTNVQVRPGGALVLDPDGKDGFNGQGYATENTSTAFRDSTALDFAADAAFEVTLTLGPGYSYNLENVSFFAQRNANGPQSVGFFYSTDSGASWNQVGTTLALGTTFLTPFNFVDGANMIDGWTGTVQLRIYAWNAAASGSQQIRIDELYIEGAVIPEPGTASLAVLAAALFALRRRWIC